MVHAMKSDFLDIFKDYNGVYWSHNVVFILISAACLIIGVFATFDIIAIGVLSVIYNYDASATILATGTVATGLITALQGINVWQKKSAVDQIIKKQDVQNNANPST